MSRMAHDDIEVRGLTVTKGLRFATMTKQLAATFVVDKDMPPVMTLDANGAARNVTMPAETDANRGLAFLIRNGAAGAFALTIKASDGATTVGTIAQNQSAWVVLAPALASAATLSWTVHPA